ncbi:MAG: hypothetical protein K0S51_1492 [Bacillales bacterium]|jgi:capsular polysaccharide biosynthesis protein|nr:hypothetical protein [Bacillales bacterium]
MISSLIQSIYKRFRKLFIVLLILPILGAVIGYFTSKSIKPIYTAKTTVITGNFDREKLSSLGYLKGSVSSGNFLNEAMRKNDINESGDVLKNQITILDISPISAQITYSTTNRDYQKIMNAIIDQYLEKSNEGYNLRKELLSQQIKKIENSDYHPDQEADMQRLTYDLKDRIISLSGNETTEISFGQIEISEKKRTILGFLIGTMVSLLILVIPEFFVIKPE